ncbi:hypothetical protein HID58_070832, partial [Brassica napus]
VYEFPVVRLFLMMLYAVLIWLMLGTTSPWVGSEFIGLPLIVPARLGFQDLFFVRARFHSLLILCSLFFFLCSLISLHFSSLVASLVAHHFTMFAIPGLDSVFLRVWNIISCLKFELWFLCGWLPFSLPYNFVVLRWHGLLIWSCFVCEACVFQLHGDFGLP